ncbi:hypothetical protein OS493_031065 [Desmophyllum pertusum]|uniref:Uncharacterized protein n=1 Tax=Desmophyllum pertusum TaxID=174260 RepID=A0A9X0CI03_9CNID|nr:hypothetical protein OS493_031065 [Desmophyllum pertusum]
MAAKRASKSTPNVSKDSIVVTDDQDFETDLEDDLEDLVEAEKNKLDKTTAERYYDACEVLKTVPVAKFVRQCKTGHVDLKHYGIRDIGAKAVAMALPHDITVTSLCLHDNGIGDAGSVALSRMLKDNCFVLNFDLSENKIGKEGARAIADMLLENASLQEVNLSGCGIHGKDIKQFLNALSFNPRLKSLDFSYNDLGDEGAIHLGRALSKNQKVEFLDVSWNNIRVSGIEELAKGLARNKNLKELELSWNCFLDEGANHLSSALVHNRCLKVLEMQSCGIHTAGAFKMADALKANQCLEVLRIGKNPFQSSGACSLLRGVKCNQTGALRELLLDDVVFDKECGREIDALLEERPNFSCSWDVSIRGGHAAKGKKKKPDAVEIFLAFVRTRGLRLIDLFRMLAKDGNATTITKTEFIAGMKKLNAPLKDHQLRVLFDGLDVNHDEHVEFYEFLSSRSHYLKAGRK